MLLATVYAFLADGNQMDLPNPDLNPAQGDQSAFTSLTHLMEFVRYAQYFGLFTCLAAMLYGGATWALGGLGGNSGGQSKGKTYVICGAVGALAIGMCIPIMQAVVDAIGTTK